MSSGSRLDRAVVLAEGKAALARHESAYELGLEPLVDELFVAGKKPMSEPTDRLTAARVRLGTFGASAPPGIPVVVRESNSPGIIMPDDPTAWTLETMCALTNAFVDGGVCPHFSYCFAHHFTGARRTDPGGVVQWIEEGEAGTAQALERGAIGHESELLTCLAQTLFAAATLAYAGASHNDLYLRNVVLTYDAAAPVRTYMLQTSSRGSRANTH